MVRICTRTWCRIPGQSSIRRVYRAIWIRGRIPKLSPELRTALDEQDRKVGNATAPVLGTAAAGAAFTADFIADFFILFGNLSGPAKGDYNPIDNSVHYKEFVWKTLTGKSYPFAPSPEETAQLARTGENLVGALWAPEAFGSKLQAPKPDWSGTEIDPSQPPDPRLRLINPADLRWSQTTAGGGGRADKVGPSLSKEGWNGDAIDVVQTEDGLVTVDHTRAAIALKLGIKSIPVIVHEVNEPLPMDMLTRGWDRAGTTARTWGEAVKIRAAGQTPPLGPTGTENPPKLMYQQK